MNTSPRFVPRALAAQEEASALAWYVERALQRPLLSADEEASLARTIRKGQKAEQDLEADPFRPGAERLRAAQAAGLAAQDRMVEANLRLVVSMARGYQGQGVSLMDLIQEGNIGLIAAVKKFDAGRRLRFSTYASWWIRRGLTRVIIDHGRCIRLSEDAWLAVRKLKRALSTGALVAEEGSAALRAAAEELGIDESSARELLLWSRREPSSLSAAHTEDGPPMEGLIRDPEADRTFEAVDLAVFAEWLRDVMAETLEPQELEVLRLRFGIAESDSLSLKRVGGLMGISGEAVRQVEMRALEKLRNQLEALEARESA